MPGEVHHIELSHELARRGMPGPIDDAGIDIAHNGAVGSIIACLTNLDQSRDYSFDVPIKDPVAGMNRTSGNYPWRLDSEQSTVLHLKNTIDREVHAVVQVRYAGADQAGALSDGGPRPAAVEGQAAERHSR